MSSRITVLFLVCILIWPTLALAAPAENDLASENEALRERVGRLEAELEKVKDLLTESGTARTLPADDGDGVSAAVEALLARYPAAALGAGESANGFSVVPYGYIKLDMSYDTSAVSNGNFARWVESEEYNEDDDRTSITARQTRFGLKIRGPVNGVILTGQIELDFYGSGAENKPQPFMRHAFMKIEWPDNGWSLIAGQTWDVVSPVNPNTLNYPVAWWAGNWGYRRPQLRITKVADLNDDTTLTVAVAATRNIGDQSPFNSTDAGADSGIPVFQARVALTLPIFDAPKPATIGLWGHWGTEEYDTDMKGDSEDYKTNSIGIDLTLPVWDCLTIKGEFFHGQDLDAYLGGIGQGVNLVEMEEIQSRGGWVGAAWTLDPQWTVNFGGSMEDVDEDDLSAGGRKKNTSVWGNIIWSPLKNFKTGIEVSHWKTQYKDMEDGKDLRLQLSFIYSF